MLAGDVAIIGMDCVFPGALSAREYWDNLVMGVDCIQDIPAGRLNEAQNCTYPESHEAYISCLRGGFIPETFRFEPLRFGIMPKLVQHGAPDQFLAIHVAEAALRDTGIPEDALDRQNCDVIIGRGGYFSNMAGELYIRTELIDRICFFLAARYSSLTDDELHSLEKDLRRTLPPNEADCYSTVLPNLVASRIANRLNLGGSAYIVDAACASSLIAVEQAVDRLRRRASNLAIVGGVFLSQTPELWFVFTQLKALSPTGVLRPFDVRADGLVVGEGAGAVVLKRLEEALNDRNRIYAVIRGAASSSDGLSGGPWAPSMEGQANALRRAYEISGIDPATVTYLEAHGTGTPTGDAVEIETIKTIFGSGSSPSSKRRMGSVKSMIGHTMPAAGIASLIKTALCLHHRLIPPTCNCQNPLPALKQLPFYINDKTEKWDMTKNGQPRRAGVNAFGFGGINAHLILEEAPQKLTRSHKVTGPRDTLKESSIDQTGLAAAIKETQNYSVPLQLDWVPFRTDRFETRRGLPDEDSPGASLYIPVLGEVRHFVPNREIVVERTLDLEKDIFLRDHCFINTDDYSHAEQRFPVMPMTMSIELMAEAAAFLAPSMGLVTVEEVQASRWINLPNGTPVDLRIEGVSLNEGYAAIRRIFTRILSGENIYISATFEFASAYPNLQGRKDTPPTDLSPSRITAENYYKERYTFHGPSFQSVSAVYGMYDKGLVGEIMILAGCGLFASGSAPAMLLDPVALDGAGQLFGLRMQLDDKIVLPVGVRKICIYQPTPLPGTKATVSVQVVDHNEELRTAVGDINVYTAEGTLWMGIEGWRTWASRVSKPVFDFSRHPLHFCLSTELKPETAENDEVITMIREADLSETDIDWFIPQIFGIEEAGNFDAIMYRSATNSAMLGRIAAKDAARIWLSRRDNTSIRLPTEIRVLNDPSGNPYLVVPSEDNPAPQISISHTAGCAVAIASERRVGIDVEPVSRDVSSLLTEFLSAKEIQKIRNWEKSRPETNWPLLAWCAKEAAAKALGTGFKGRPQSLVIDSLHEGGIAVVESNSTQVQLIASTTTAEGVLISTVRLRES